MSQKTKSTKDDLATRICIVAQCAKSDGFEDVSAWMQRYLAMDIRPSRMTRKRGVHARIGSARGPKSFLDAARVKEMARAHGEQMTNEHSR